ncbi:MAG: GNAT family N-acetyltransferase [Oscillospiraceae bacterium]|nr:GNAT family N-acetyltransferase [Oscillospiraceae bacterium]
MQLKLRKCGTDNLNTLRDLAIRTYWETYGSQNTPENMDAYIQTAFHPDQLLSELNDPNSEFFFLYADDVLAGFIKLNEAPSQTDVNDKESLQLERLYVSGSFQGMGLGQFLMDNAIGIAVQRGKKYIWLCAWEYNHKALRFYKKNGFWKMGAHTIFMGDDEQTDYLLRKNLQ